MKEEKKQLKKQDTQEDSIKKAPIISTENLNVIYNQGEDNEAHILKDVTLQINEGEYIIIFGPSGCGKSTLLFSMSGLQKATTGTVIVDGLNISLEDKESEKMVNLHRNTLSTIFQAFHLLPSLNVFKNVSLPSIFNDEPRDTRDKRVTAMLKRFGIEGQAKKLPSQVSGGQKQRVAIARALMNNPKVLFADEPVGNLDAESAEVLLNILVDLNEREGRTIILVTHDPRHLVFADRIIYMNDGTVVREVINEKKGKMENIKEIPEDAGMGIVRNWKEQKEYEMLIQNIAMSRKQLAIVENKAELIKRREIALKRSVPLNSQFLETPELNVLTKSFGDFSTTWKPKTLGTFKIEQLTQHLLLGMSDMQTKIVEDAVQESIVDGSQADYEGMLKRLTTRLEKGGAHLNPGIAKNIVDNTRGLVRALVYLSNTTKKLSGNHHKIEYLYKLFVDKYDLHIKDNKIKEDFKKVLTQRLDNAIDTLETQRQLGIVLSAMNKGTSQHIAKKITNTLEIIMLMLFVPQIEKQKKEKKKPSAISQMSTSKK